MSTSSSDGIESGDFAANRRPSDPSCEEWNHHVLVPQRFYPCFGHSGFCVSFHLYSYFFGVPHLPVRGEIHILEDPCQKQRPFRIRRSINVSSWCDLQIGRSSTRASLCWIVCHVFLQGTLGNLPHRESCGKFLKVPCDEAIYLSRIGAGRPLGPESISDHRM